MTENHFYNLYWLLNVLVPLKCEGSVLFFFWHDGKLNILGGLTGFNVVLSSSHRSTVTWTLPAPHFPHQLSPYKAHLGNLLGLSLHVQPSYSAEPAECDHLSAFVGLVTRLLTALLCLSTILRYCTLLMHLHFMLLSAFTPFTFQKQILYFFIYSNTFIWQLQFLWRSQFCKETIWSTYDATILNII